MTENQCLGRIYRQITEAGVTFHNLFIILQQNVMLKNFLHQQCLFEFFPTGVVMFSILVCSTRYPEFVACDPTKCLMSTPTDFL